MACDRNVYCSMHVVHSLRIVCAVACNLPEVWGHLCLVRATAAVLSLSNCLQVGSTSDRESANYIHVFQMFETPGLKLQLGCALFLVPLPTAL